MPEECLSSRQPQRSELGQVPRVESAIRFDAFELTLRQCIAASFTANTELKIRYTTILYGIGRVSSRRNVTVDLAVNASASETRLPLLNGFAASYG